MGVWIEIYWASLEDIEHTVTPCMGVWIETFRPLPVTIAWAGHTLYGCVD